MGKRIIIGAVLVVAGVSIGAATKPALKFPWAGEDLNAPVTRTVLEWKIASGDIAPYAWSVAMPEWELTHLVAIPYENGLLIRANVARQTGFSVAQGDKCFHRAQIAIEKESRTRFLEPPDVFPKVADPAFASKRPFTDWQNCRYELWRDNRLFESKGMTKEALGKPLPNRR